jgi:hypothetical protein
MNKIAVVVLADAETHADTGRLANAMELAKEAGEQGDEVRIVFDGAGTRWVPVLTNESNQLNAYYRAVHHLIDGACAFCASAFHVKAEIQETDVPLISDYEGHPSLRGYIQEGYQVVTF